MRTWSIIHLCIASTLLSWLFCQPFASRHIRTQMETQLAQEVVEGPWFTSLPLSEQEHWLTFEPAATLSPPRLTAPICAWLFFSYILCILFLLDVRGIAMAVWLLPLLIFFASPPATPKSDLFPTEEVLYREYLREPKARSIAEQREQIERGWRLYLIEQWGEGEGLERAQWAFRREQLRQGVVEPAPSVWLPLLIWNLIFSAAITQVARRRESEMRQRPTRAS